MFRLISLLLLTSLISTEDSTYSIDSLFYEHSQLAMALFKKQPFVNDSQAQFHDAYLPAIVYFTSSNKQNHTADILKIQLIQSGFFRKLQMHLFLFGLNRSSHKWQGRGQIELKRVDNLLMSNSTGYAVYFIINQSTINFNLNARYRMYIHLDYSSNISHYTLIKVIMVIITGIALILTIRQFENVHVISSQCHQISLMLLLSRYLTDCILITIDNFAFSKQTSTLYADALLMLLSYMLLVLVSMLLFPTVSLKSWKKIVILLVVAVIQLVLVGYAVWNILMSFLLVPQFFKKGYSKGDTVMILLFLYFQLSNLIVHLFHDNYLYYKAQKWMLIVVTVLTVVQCIVVILKKRQRTEYPLEMSSSIQLQSHSVLCPVCRLVIKDPTSETSLPCSHIFHRQCLRQHLRQSEVCPIDKILIDKSQLSLVET